MEPHPGYGVSSCLMLSALTSCQFLWSAQYVARFPAAADTLQRCHRQQSLVGGAGSLAGYTRVLHFEGSRVGHDAINRRRWITFHVVALLSLGEGCGEPGTKTSDALRL